MYWLTYYLLALVRIFASDVDGVIDGSVKTVGQPSHIQAIDCIGCFPFSSVNIVLPCHIICSIDFTTACRKILFHVWQGVVSTELILCSIQGYCTRSKSLVMCQCKHITVANPALVVRRHTTDQQRRAVGDGDGGNLVDDICGESRSRLPFYFAPSSSAVTTTFILPGICPFHLSIHRSNVCSAGRCLVDDVGVDAVVANDRIRDIDGSTVRLRTILERNGHRFADTLLAFRLRIDVRSFSRFLLRNLTCQRKGAPTTTVSKHFCAFRIQIPDKIHILIITEEENRIPNLISTSDGIFFYPIRSHLRCERICRYRIGVQFFVEQRENKLVARKR